MLCFTGCIREGWTAAALFQHGNICFVPDANANGVQGAICLRTDVVCGTHCRDDLAWAAAWLYRETGDNAYLSDAYFFYSQHQTQEGDYDKRYLVCFFALRLSAAVPFESFRQADQQPAPLSSTLDALPGMQGVAHLQ